MGFFQVRKLSRKIYTISIVVFLEVGLAFSSGIPKMSGGDILDRLTEAKIIDDIIPKAPYEQLEVHYKNWTVNFGNEIPPKVMNEPPEIRWPAPNGTMYTLLIVGPDVPTKEEPDESDWLHWLVGNIPNNDTSKGEVRADYVGLERPMYQKGTHRIVYLLYKHPDNLPVLYFGSVIKKRGEFYDRSFFVPNQLSKEHKFKNPIAVNFATVTLGKYGSDD